MKPLLDKNYNLMGIQFGLSYLVNDFIGADDPNEIIKTTGAESYISTN